jgi:hypothetical protein
MNTTTIGLDIAKSCFQVHGVDAHGKTTLQKTRLLGIKRGDRYLRTLFILGWRWVNGRGVRLAIFVPSRFH